MQERAPADGADLAHGEESGDGERAEDVVDRGDVVVGFGEEAGAAAVAAEQERPADSGAGTCLPLEVIRGTGEILSRQSLMPARGYLE